MGKGKQKAVFGVWSQIGIGDLNRLLKPFSCRLVLKKSKEWGDAVSVTAHPVAVNPDGDSIPEVQLAASLRRLIAVVETDVLSHSEGDVTDGAYAARDDAVALLKRLGLFRGTDEVARG